MTIDEAIKEANLGEFKLLLYMPQLDILFSTS